MSMLVLPTHPSPASTSLAFLASIGFFCLNGFAFLFFHVSSLSPQHRVPWLLRTHTTLHAEGLAAKA
jgi:hypothetical protein